MCGIVYSKSFVGKPVNKTIARRYLAQRHRGHNGFGFFDPDTNTLTHNPREGRIMSLLRRSRKSEEILYHHRMPTSTENVRNACHPFSTKDYFKHNYVLVHNGVLWNEHELKAEHEKLGIDYVSEQTDGSFNDSEALTYDVARYIEGQVNHVSAQGSIAFICIQMDKKGSKKALYFGRNDGNPLVMKHTPSSLTLSSEGEGESVDANTLYRYDYKKMKLSRSPLMIPSRISSGNVHTYIGPGVLAGPGDNYDNDRWTTVGNRDKDLEESYISWQMDDLMSEAYEDVELAIELGEEDIKKLNKRLTYLDEALHVYESATQEEKDEYYAKLDRVQYLKKAVDSLRRGVSEENQIGFHFTPDGGSYPGTGALPYSEELSRFRQQPRHPGKKY